MGSERKRNSSNSGMTFTEGLRRFCKSYKKFWWLSLVSCVLLVAISFAYFSTTFQPRYSSRVRFTITPLVSSDAENGASVYSFNYNATLATQMASTFPYIINSGILSDIIVNDIGRPVNGIISAEAVTDTNIFEIEVTSTSPKDAYDIIYSIIENYPKVAEYVVGDTRMNVIEGSEPEMATEPYNEGEYYSYVALCGVIGILIGAGAALIDMHTRKTVAGKRDIETYFNGKCICEIPVVKKKRTSNSGSMLKISPSLSGFSESIRVLKQRTRSALKNNKAKIVGITSSVSNEGKTTIAYNLAKSFSGGEERVLLIDMDMQSRGVQSNLNSKKEVPDLGIADIVAGKIAIADAINSVSDTLDVLFAGEDSVKFRKERFAPIFEYAKQHYDYVVVDMSTCTISSETVSMADLCDELLFVVRANAVSPDKVYNTLKDLAFSDVKMIGFVLNFVEPNLAEMGGYKYYGRYGKHRYGYGYGYSYSNYGRSYNYSQNSDVVSSSPQVKPKDGK